MMEIDPPTQRSSTLPLHTQQGPEPEPEPNKSSNSIEPRHFTSRSPRWTYLHLRLISDHPQPPLDTLTTKTTLTSALTQYLGLTGAAISVDIMHVIPDKREAWVRVPRDDASAVVAGLSSWVGSSASAEEGGITWRVLGWGAFPSAICHGSGSDLF
ncbi:hypothetical protein VTN49DRAFT_1378 [Thermomyces lanuginosus]|uniref:uncharacterized protein n=1 Tax=Thermomyces lanuginosus TaxID=5541 RepID=UPI0037433DAD